MENLTFAPGKTARHYPSLLKTNSAYPVHIIHLDLIRIESYDHAQLMMLIEQQGNIIWVSAEYGLFRCEVLYFDDTCVILRNGVTVYEIVS